MTLPIQIPDALCRFTEIYDSISLPDIPDELKLAASRAPDLSHIREPLPSRRSEYTCSLEKDGVLWLGAETGLTRYDPKASRECDRVMYFCADRDLPDNRIKSLWAEGDAVWVLTEKGAAKIEMRSVSAREKADLLRKETLELVDRRGMVSQKYLSIPRYLDSKLPYNHSDNDGCFTAGHALAELFRYATLAREQGAHDSETQEALSSAVRATEACLLLMYISGRGNGFVARTYLTPHEPLPDDGLFYRKNGGKAVALATRAAKRRGIAGLTIDASHPVPDRLARLYRDEGFSDDGIVYKGDTSSDEITLHFLLILFAHDILGAVDPELDALLLEAGANTLNHILDNGLRLMECNGKPTTWAKWDEAYFNTMFGWADACLNAAEILLYLRVMMHVTGQQGRWRETYEHLLDKGYGRLTTLHAERFHISAMLQGCEPVEDLMYGDHMLATAAYWALITLEDDEQRKELFRKGYKGWNGTFRREHNPGYDFPFLLACPDQEIDTESVIDWFRRTNCSRLASGISLETRHDVPKRIRFGGKQETGILLPPDERFISKFDRNPYEWKETEGGSACVESCYVYTFSYWLGRYYGFIAP